MILSSHGEKQASYADFIEVGLDKLAAVIAKETLNKPQAIGRPW